MTRNTSPRFFSFAILAYIEKRGTDDEEMYERYLYIVLSRIGNLQTFNTVRARTGRCQLRGEAHFIA